MKICLFLGQKRLLMIEKRILYELLWISLVWAAIVPTLEVHKHWLHLSTLSYLRLYFPKGCFHKPLLWKWKSPFKDIIQNISRLNWKLNIQVEVVKMKTKKIWWSVNFCYMMYVADFVSLQWLFLQHYSKLSVLSLSRTFEY